MFKFLRRKQALTSQQPPAPEDDLRQANQTTKAPAETVRPVDFSCPISDEEREIVSAVAGAILAGDNTDSVFRVKSVTGIDSDKEAAAAVVAAVLSSDRSDTIFRLKSIAEIK